MKWFYASGGVQVGPIEEAELDRLVGQGVIRGDTLVWNEGLSGWQPLGVVRGWPNAGTPTPVGSAQVAVLGHVHYGGFWIRFVARLIDGILLGIVNAIIRIPIFLMLGVSSSFGTGLGRVGGGAIALPAIMGALGLSIVISLAIGVIYEVYFVSTRGATLGKLALGLKIVRADGGPVSAGLALGRYFAQWLSGAILLIGYIMAGFDAEKRALHDHICQTRVIYSR